MMLKASVRTKVFSRLKLWAQGHLIVSSANNLNTKQEEKDRTIKFSKTKNLNKKKKSVVLSDIYFFPCHSQELHEDLWQHVSAIRTSGQRQVLASVMVKDAMVTGRKSSILG